MSNLVKFTNINMSESPVVIKDGEDKPKEDLSDTSSNQQLQDNVAVGGDENEPELPQEQIEKIKKIEEQAIINARNIEEQAKRDAQRILLEVESKVDKLKIYNQRELNKQIDEIKEEARQKAREDARNEVLESMNAMSKRLDDCIKGLEDNQKKFFISLEKNLPQFALEIAGKILFKRVTETPEEMDMLIKNTIAGIKGATWIDIKVGENLKDVAKEILDEMVQNLKDRGTTLDIQNVKENNWEVVAESDKGIIDASINTQIQNFMEYIETYQKKQGE